ncbi:MAG: HD domain-containing protein [Cyanobacteria bacterium P01_A01_bin.123]
MMQRLVLTHTFEKALEYAVQLHRHQWRKVNEAPYVSHLLAVAALVLEDGGSESEAIAALFHDAVEDQGGDSTLAQIRVRFGEAVAEIVQGCTEPPRAQYPSWYDHKRAYFEQVRSALPAVQRVLLADKLHNGRSLLRNWAEFGEAMWGAFKGDRAQVLWFYQQAATCFGEVKSGWMADELARVAERLAQMDKAHDAV